MNESDYPVHKTNLNYSSTQADWYGSQIQWSGHSGKQLTGGKKPVNKNSNCGLSKKAIVLL